MLVVLPKQAHMMAPWKANRLSLAAMFPANDVSLIAQSYVWQLSTTVCDPSLATGYLIARVNTFFEQKCIIVETCYDTTYVVCL